MSDAAKGAASVVLFLGIVAMAYAAHPPVPVPKAVCMSVGDRDKVRALMHDGFDVALKDHVKSIFDVYLRDHADTTQRAAAGIHNGTAAYVRSRAAVLAWDPPECKP